MLSSLAWVKDSNLTNICSGGTVLNTLLKSNHNSLQNLEISVLVRGEEKEKVLAGLGVKPIYFNSLDDSDIITKAASENDSEKFM